MDSGLMQSLAAGMIVLAAGIYVGRRGWRTLASARRGSADAASCGEGGACGCGGTSAASPGKANTFDSTAQ